MSRGSFSRAVARAAASGGSRAYRGKSPRGWYALITLICALGVGLIWYSRYENLHPYKPPAVHPTASDHWYAALGVDVCGKLQPNLAASPNFTTVGLRTAGDGVILVDPGAATSPSSFTGKHDTLGTFLGNYPGVTLSATSLQLPGKTVLRNGQRCTTALGPLTGPGRLVVETWPSARSTQGTISTNPASVKLLNGMLATIGFVPKGAALPKPPASALKALQGDLTGNAVSAPPAAPTTSTTTTPTTVPATSSTVGKPASSTTAPAKVTSGGGSGSVPSTTLGAAGVATH
jgi:hypothetical protein